MLSDAQLERFSRQLLLPGFDLEHQERLLAAHVLIVGCGGLGNPLALYLAAAGVGSLTLADGDQVSRSNLHRQVLFTDEQLGQPKASSLAVALSAHTPACHIQAIDAYLEAEALHSAVRDADLVADASDNFPTRYAINRSCIAAKKPWVSAAAVRTEGQLLSIDVANGTPCYRCLYPREGDASALSCSESGVLGPVVGMMAMLQALEIIKQLTGWGEPLGGRLLMVDLASYAQQTLTLSRRDDCPDCA
ncbi:MAG: molybdopterin-synthase adenylyltransferase MoeB [Congregibacter sp.]